MPGRSCARRGRAPRRPALRVLPSIRSRRGRSPAQVLKRCVAASARLHRGDNERTPFIDVREHWVACRGSHLMSRARCRGRPPRCSCRAPRLTAIRISHVNPSGSVKGSACCHHEPCDRASGEARRPWPGTALVKAPSLTGLDGVANSTYLRPSIFATARPRST